MNKDKGFTNYDDLMDMEDTVFARIPPTTVHDLFLEWDGGDYKAFMQVLALYFDLAAPTHERTATARGLTLEEMSVALHVSNNTIH